jgi:hypothetical protein
VNETPRAGGRPDEPQHHRREVPPLSGRLAREFLTMRHMVDLWCQDHHGEAAAHPCPSCADFLAYAERRLGKCPYGQQKPTCSNCPVHCYKPAPREFAKEVMRYSGPRMMTRHPWLALLHLADGRRKVDHPMASRRRDRPSP